MRLLLLINFWALTISTLFVSSSAQAEEKVKHPLLGLWEVVSVYDRGKRIEIPPFTIEFSLDRMITTVGGVATECHYRLHDNEKPKQVDLLLDLGDGLILVGKGIYDIEVDTLRWCVARTDKTRPKTLRAETGDGVRYSVFHRHKQDGK